MLPVLRSSRSILRHTQVPHCGGALYNPVHLRTHDGRELVYAMGGFMKDGVIDPPLFVDLIWVSERQKDGSWTLPLTNCITKWSFPWQANEDEANRLWAARAPEYIGGCGGPTVFQLPGDDRVYMLFPASVSDAERCTGEHKEERCRTPWNHFAVYLASSPDGVHDWRLHDMERDNPNVALRHAVLYREPSEKDKAAFTRAENPHIYAALSAVSAVADRGFVNVIAQFWAAPDDSPMGQKNLLMRARVEDLSAWEIWRSGETFEPMTGGVIPEWANDSWGAGNPHPLIINAISRTTLIPGFDYIATFPIDGPNFGGRPDSKSNSVGVVLSNNLRDWTPLEQWPTTIKTLDAHGGNSLCIGPFYYERDGQPRLLYASTDLNLDGIGDCVDAAGATGGYGGTEVFDAGAEAMPKIGKHRAVATSVTA